MLIACYSSTFSQQIFDQRNPVSFDGSVISSPPKEANEVTGKAPWPAYVKTDLRQVTKWLNQDMDEAARFLQSPKSRSTYISRNTNNGFNTNQRPGLGTGPGQKTNWLANLDNPLSDSDSLETS